MCMKDSEPGRKEHRAKRHLISDRVIVDAVAFILEQVTASSLGEYNDAVRGQQLWHCKHSSLPFFVCAHSRAADLAKIHLGPALDD